ncbi:MAG: 50S ribosomal protein L5 [Candidatus Rariloculaceae bacterium]
MSRLQEYFQQEATPQIMKRLKITNPMAVPQISKITLNMGVGEALTDRKVLEHAVSDLKRISGQQPVICNARVSVATFKLRAGFPIGCKVTLRRQRMYEFLDRLVNVAIPRVRDFRGLSARSFDGQGNFSIGVKEQIIFPEIDFDQIDAIRGLDISITTTARNDEEGRALLDAFRLPLRN